MAATALKPPPVDPLRQALVDAIADLAAAKQQVENHKAATRKCWAAMREAEAAVTKAEKGIKESRIDAVAAAAGDPDDVLVLPSTVALAKAAHADALETVENLRAARQQLRETQSHFEEAVRAADARVDAAISEILLPIAQRCLDQMTEFIRLAQPTRELLLGLLESHNDRAISWRGKQPLEPALAEANALAFRSSLVDLVPNNVWALARSRLREDPHADIEVAGLT